ncbi:MAG: hypothetical protein ACI37O_01625 [Candidatus Avelusimicrobium sp.]|uniref:hypothetical protein n=1 Tax=Candidatus Avelusimicrobium sp. TaxID=3048833 RepID=UPI003EFEB342
MNGAKLTDNKKGLKKLFERLNKMTRRFTGEWNAEVGVVQNATGTDKRTGKPKRISIAQEAFYNCKGVPEKNIPARDYQTKAIKQFMPKWRAELKRQLKKQSREEWKTGKSRLTDKKIMEGLGATAAGDVKYTIETGDFEPNSPATIARKSRGNYRKLRRKGLSAEESASALAGSGTKTPLIDYGDLLNAQKAAIYKGNKLTGIKSAKRR